MSAATALVLKLHRATTDFVHGRVSMGAETGASAQKDPNVYRRIHFAYRDS